MSEDKAKKAMQESSNPKRPNSLPDKAQELINRLVKNEDTLPFYLLELGGDIKFRDWSKSPGYLNLLEKFQSGKLQEENPRIENVQVYHKLTADMLNAAVTVRTDENGNLPVPLEHPEFAAYCLYHAKYSACLPNARMHPKSPKLPEALLNPEYWRNLAKTPLEVGNKG